MDINVIDENHVIVDGKEYEALYSDEGSCDGCAFNGYCTEEILNHIGCISDCRSDNKYVMWVPKNGLKTGLKTDLKIGMKISTSIGNGKISYISKQNILIEEDGGNEFFINKEHDWFQIIIDKKDINFG